MRDIEFNLIDEPWIRVITPNCQMREVGLREALIYAHEYRDLGGEMAAQDVAVLRLLIAIVHTVISRAAEVEDDNGDGTEDEEISSVLQDCFKPLWSSGRFPEQQISDYLDKWHERFWLFHPDRPFYQVASITKGTWCDAAKLNGTASESGNKLRMFSMLANEGKVSMSYAEAARWLLFINGFDDCAAKQVDKSHGLRQMPIAWLGKLGLVIAIGENLFETIMLNMRMLNYGGMPWEYDRPVWEMSEVRSGERVTVNMPENLAELFTLQSRRILLKREAARVTGYLLQGGDVLDDNGALDEPMTLWAKQIDKETNVSVMRPLLHERARQIWREFGSMVEYDSDNKRPGVVAWVDILHRCRILNKRNVTFRIVCMRYDSKLSSSITDSFSDALSFHADLLNEVGKYWQMEVSRQIKKVESVAKAVQTLVIHIGVAAGRLKGTESLNEQAAFARLVTERFFDSIDQPFRDWLYSLEPAQDVEQRSMLISQWQKIARNIALSLGQQLVVDAGDVAFMGREVKIKIKRYYSTPNAFGEFKLAVIRQYPYHG